MPSLQVGAESLLFPASLSPCPILLQTPAQVLLTKLGVADGDIVELRRSQPLEQPNTFNVSVVVVPDSPAAETGAEAATAGGSSEQRPEKRARTAAPSAAPQPREEPQKSESRRILGEHAAVEPGIASPA